MGGYGHKKGRAARGPAGEISIELKNSLLLQAPLPPQQPQTQQAAAQQENGGREGDGRHIKQNMIKEGLGFVCE